jgi:hypothetical protein
MNGPAALNAAMDRQRLTLRKRWRAVAQEAGISISQLNKIRDGSVPLTEFAAAGIDLALGWDVGGAWRIYQEAGGRDVEDPPFELLDDTERRIWSFSTLSADERLDVIEQHRKDKQSAAS